MAAVAWIWPGSTNSNNLEPKPCRLGAETAGPPLSTQSDVYKRQMEDLAHAQALPRDHWILAVRDKGESNKANPIGRRGHIQVRAG